MKRVMLLLLAATTFILAAEPKAKTYSETEAWELGWPMVSGPFGNFVPARTGVKLVDDLKDVRVVWESEDKDFGRAKCSTGLSRNFATKPGTYCSVGAQIHGGSWAGPIIGDGKVFSAAFRPGGKQYDLAGGKGSLEADDVLVALDARTGKTVWKAVEPGGFMWGMGKRGGWQIAPAYAGGRVFFVGTTGRLFAYESATGKKLWENDIGAARVALEAAKKKALALHEKGKMPVTIGLYNWRTSLVVADNMLIVPLIEGTDIGLRGVEPATGKTKWELKAVCSRYATPALWRSSGKEYLLCATISPGPRGKPAMRLIAPATGKVLWTVAGLAPTYYSLTPSATHVIVNHASKAAGKRGATFAVPAAYRITPARAERAWAFPDKPEFRFQNWMDCCAQRRMLLHDGLLYIQVGNPDGDAATPGKETAYADMTTAQRRASRFLVARLDDGEVLAAYDNDDKDRATSPGNTYGSGDFERVGGLFYLIEDRIFCRANATHGPSHGGRHPFAFWKFANGKIERASPTGLDKHDLATAYEVYMEYPIVAGRVWMRDERGFIVCYDLRAKE